MIPRLIWITTSGMGTKRRTPSAMSGARTAAKAIRTRVGMAASTRHAACPRLARVLTPATSRAHTLGARHLACQRSDPGVIGDVRAALG